MKYLVFNAVVFLALGYLIAGGEPKEFKSNMEQSVQKVKTQTQATLAKPAPVSKEIPAQTKVAQPIEPQPVVSQKKQAEKIEPIKEVKKPTTPPPLPSAVKVAKVEAKKAPAPSVEPITQSVEVAQTTQEPETALMSAKERSKALRQMVADMEQMFARKMTQ
ncbi:MAG: hypothetical protein ACNI26_04515 [Terasakiella sp.]|uniref:hypothetical protein n=1 Tax=unclassified Terasakiella TaxID=2614952 RepID=UPI003B009916